VCVSLRGRPAGKNPHLVPPYPRSIDENARAAAKSTGAGARFMRADNVDIYIAPRQKTNRDSHRQARLVGKTRGQWAAFRLADVALRRRNVPPPLRTKFNVHTLPGPWPIAAGAEQKGAELRTA